MAVKALTSRGGDNGIGDNLPAADAFEMKAIQPEVALTKGSLAKGPLTNGPPSASV